MDIAVTVVLTLGTLFTLLAGIGMVRFRDVWARMHAAAKAPVLGLLLVGVGVILAARSVQVTLLVGLTIAFQMIASPVGSHVLARSTYRRVHPDVDGPDELRDAERAPAEAADAAEAGHDAPSDTP